MTKFDKLLRLRLNKSAAGYELLQFVFNAADSLGAVRSFFIELALINPALSPDHTVLGYKSRAKVGDLGDVILDTQVSRNMAHESTVLPSYIAVRAGSIGEHSRQFAVYHNLRDVNFSTRTFEVTTPSGTFSTTSLKGQLAISQSDLDTHPEWFCDSGNIAWDIQTHCHVCFGHGYRGAYNWLTSSVDFTGTITLDGTQYTITNKQPGFIEHFWGKDLSPTYLRINATRLISVITGKPLDSYLSIGGIFGNDKATDGRASLLLDLADGQFVFTSNSRKSAYTASSDVTECADGRLHWSVSIHSHSYVIDIDAFCEHETLCVRLWERASYHGQQQILTSPCGMGQLRLYARHHKDLVLLEEARFTANLAYGKCD